MYAHFTFVKFCGRKDVTPDLRVYNSSALNYSIGLLKSGKENLEGKGRLPFDLDFSTFEILIPKHRNLTIPVTVITSENISYYGYSLLKFEPNMTIYPIEPLQPRYFTIGHECVYDGRSFGNLTVRINDLEYIIHFILEISFTNLNMSVM